MSDDPHFSVTQLTMYSRCPQQYAYRYLDGEKVPPGIALLHGRGFHGGMEMAMKEKIATGRNVRPTDVRDAAVAEFDGAIEQSGVLLTREEESRGAVVVVAEARDRVAATAHYAGAVAVPELRPIASELVISLPTDEVIGVPLVGVVDLVEENSITDFKTTTRSLSQRDADTHLQLTCYALWHFREKGTHPAVQLDVYSSKSGETKRTVLTSQRKRDDYERFIRRVTAVKSAIDAGSFPPCNPDSWWCSRKFCGYAAKCPYFVGRNDNG